MTPTGFRLGEFVVEPGTDRLLHLDSGTRVYLEPKTMDVLVALAERAGDVVSSSSLIENVWHGRPMGDNPVYKAVAKLRHALQDDATAPRYVETIPRKGYRLLVAPVWLAREQYSPLSHGIVESAPVGGALVTVPAARRPGTRRWLTALVFVVLAAALSVPFLHWPPLPESVARPTHAPSDVPAAPIAPTAAPVARRSVRTVATR